MKEKDLKKLMAVGVISLAVIGYLMIVNTATKNTTIWNESGIRQDYTYEERSDRGEFDHLIGFDEGLESLALAYDFDMSELSLKSLDGNDVKLKSLIIDKDKPTVVILNSSSIITSSKAIEKMMSMEWGEPHYNTVHLFLDESKGFEDTKNIIDQSSKKHYKNVGVLSNNELRRVGTTFAPVMLYLNRDNVVKNLGLPMNNMEVLVLLGLADGTVELNEHQIFTYQKAFNEIADEEDEAAAKKKDELELKGEKADEPEEVIEEEEVKEVVKEVISKKGKKNKAGFVPIEIKNEIEYGTDAVGLDEGRELGHFVHLQRDDQVMQILINNYGINMYKQQVENKEGETVFIGDIVEDKTKPTILIFGRKT